MLSWWGGRCCQACCHIGANTELFGDGLLSQWVCVVLDGKVVHYDGLCGWTTSPPSGNGTGATGSSCCSACTAPIVIPKMHTMLHVTHAGGGWMLCLCLFGHLPWLFWCSGCVC